MRWLSVTCFAFSLLAGVLGESESCHSADWQAFRGPNGDGVAPDKTVPLRWGPAQNIKWRFELPGPGNSSPIVSNGRVFVTCATEDGKHRRLYCLDRASGKLLWVRDVVWENPEPTHKTNPYCGSTPVADGQRVVVWHGSAGVWCYDFEGRTIWNRDLGEVGHVWGYGSSPIILDGKVLLNFGPGVDSFLAALDLQTGQLVWKTDEPGGANQREPRMVGSWSTPLVVSVDGQRQVVCSMPSRVVAYDPGTGRIIWTCGGLPSPRGDLVYTSVLTSGRTGVAMGGYKGPAMGFRLGGRGDVTQQNRLWRVEANQPQRIGSGVIVDGYIFVANAGPGTYQCLELSTGKEQWVKRLPGDHWGAVVFAAGHLFVTNQNGQTRVLRPSPEKFDLVSTNDLQEPSNSTPAISDSQLFLRTFQAVYCVAEEP